MTIAAILKHKGTEIGHVAPATTIPDVARLLTERRFGAVLVLDASAQLIGILSERDIVRSLARRGAETLQMTAGQLMTRVLHTVSRSTSVAEAMEMMTRYRVRHLPVIEDGQLVGIVSIGDVVKARLTQQEVEVDSLKAYVAGSV